LESELVQPAETNVAQAVRLMILLVILTGLALLAGLVLVSFAQ